MARRFYPQRPVLIGTSNVILDGQAVPYILKRSSIARYVRLEVGVRGLVVVIPPSYRPERLPELLARKRQWILRKLAEYTRIRAPDKSENNNGDFILYLGQYLPVVRSQNPGVKGGIKLEQNGLLLLNVRNGQANPIEQWYRQQAEKLIKLRVDELCPQLGVTYRRLAIRGARTRWASCSLKGNLNFNWRLMMVPEPVIDYVVIHELAHLKEMNHSRKFWMLVAEHCPCWREHRRWLKDHENETLAAARRF